MIVKRLLNLYMKCITTTCTYMYLLMHAHHIKKLTGTLQQSILFTYTSKNFHPALYSSRLLIYNPSGSKLHFEITGVDLNCLHPQEYLNDKIIDFYLM